MEPGALSGDAGNIASRIESFAVPGGVMVSEAARDPLRNRTDVELVSLGRFRLKNVGRPMELFAVSADGIVVPDSRALEGKGERFASLPGNLPRAGWTARRPSGRGRVARRAGPRASSRDCHRTRWRRQDARPGRGRPASSRESSSTAWRSSRWPTSAGPGLPSRARRALDVKEAEERTVAKVSCRSSPAGRRCCCSAISNRSSRPARRSRASSSRARTSMSSPPGGPRSGWPSSTRTPLRRSPSPASSDDGLARWAHGQAGNRPFRRARPNRRDSSSLHLRATRRRSWPCAGGGRPSPGAGAGCGTPSDPVGPGAARAARSGARRPHDRSRGHRRPPADAPRDDRLEPRPADRARNNASSGGCPSSSEESASADVEAICVDARRVGPRRA